MVPDPSATDEPSITVRLYAELNDHLPAERRQRDFELPLGGGETVAETLGRLGVPAGEVDLVLAGGRSVGLSHRLEGGERLSVFPVFERLDIAPVPGVRARPLRRTRFVLDAHLGRLAAYLRLLGFDALYRNDYDDPELVEISRRERRVLLSRDRALLARRAVTHGLRIEATAPRRQLAEVVERLDLARSAAPFTRCLACNGRLRPVPPEAVRERLPPRIRREHRRFRLCPGCDRVLWRGSHYRRMRRWVRELLGGKPGPPEASDTLGRMRTRRPAAGEAAEYYFTYIDQVPDGDVLERLERQIGETRARLAAIDEERAGFRYAPGKWSVKQVVGHVADTERVFAYRALAISRGDRQPIPGIDQDRWIEGARFGELPWAAIQEDLVAIRASTLTLFRGLSEEQWLRRGTASDLEFQAGAIAWIIAGHELHHLGVLEERYGIGG